MASAALAWPGAASAQSATDVLPPTREEVTRPVTPPTLPQGPRLEVEGGFERSPCALDGPDFQAIKFTLRGVEFDGLKGLSPAELQPAYSALIGQELPIASVCEIRDRAATILRQAGYISAVQIPEQKISDGVVRFRVLMAHLAKVQVRGDASGAEQLIAGYLNRLTEDEVFNRYEAERYLLLASDIPGYNVRLTLRPAGVPGDVIGDVTVQRTPAYADFNVQNYGSEALGRWGGLLRGQLFGLTGLGDRTTLALFTTSDFSEQQTVQLAHDFRLGNEGISFGGAFTYAWAKPDVGAGTDVRARTLLATVQADFPLIRRLSHNLRGTVGLDIVNQDVELNKIDLTRDRLRVAFARLSLDALDTQFDDPGYSLSEPPWRFAGQVEVRQGLPIFGATRDCGPVGAACLGAGNVPPSRLEGQSDATVFRGTAYGEFRPTPRLTLAAGARAQYASQPLLSFEEFSAGNYTTGRGYDPGALLGDRGFGSQLEVRYGTRMPQSAKAAAVEGYVFWDHSRVGNRDRLVVIDQSNHLNSIGGGARIAFDRFSLDAALAVPLTRVGLLDDKPGPRILISLNSRLWPWSYK